MKKLAPSAIASVSFSVAYGLGLEREGYQAKVFGAGRFPAQVRERRSINSCHRPGSFENVDFDDCPSNKNRQQWSRANLMAAVRVLLSITPAASAGGNSIPSAASSISVLSPGLARPALVGSFPDP